MRPSWKGKRVVITSGPTREAIDPIRFITNASSGRMGYALAAAARRLGARVTVVSGPTALPPPPGVTVRRVVTALEMLRATLSLARRAHVVIGAAAVGDWRAKAPPRHKLKRGPRPLRLTLVPNPDIIKETARRRRAGQVVVGFALETRRAASSAREKLRRKGLDLVVANGPGSLSGGASRAMLVRRDGSARRLPALAKERLARAILSEIGRLF